MASKINTSVDELMNLVAETDKISFKDAAKKLGVPEETIEGWAGILEDEKVVKIVYKFTKPFLVRETLSATDKKAKIKRFDAKKENLSTKMDMAATYFIDLDEQMSQINDIVESVEEHMGEKLEHIDQNLKDLAKAEQEKEKLDVKVVETKQKSLEKIQELEKHILESEHKFENSYKTIKSELVSDEKLLDENDGFINKIKRQESLLKQKLSEINELSRAMQSEMDKQTQKISDASTNVMKLKQKREQLVNEIETEHKNLSYILAQNHKQEKLIESMQEEVYKKMDAKRERIEHDREDAVHIPKQVKLLLERKRKMHDIISQIQHAEVEAKKDILRLRQEAKMLQKFVGAKDVEAELQKIHKDMEKISKQKEFFKEKLHDLLGILSVKK